MPRVLYLSYDGLTDPLGQSQILPYLCGLTDRYSITIVSFEKEDRFNRFGDAIRALCVSAGLIWKPLKYHKYPPVLSTLYDLWWMWRLTVKLNRTDRFTFLHCRSYPPALIGLWLNRKHQTKFIFDMRGFWADERIEAGLWNMKNPLFKMIYSFFKRSERSFLTKSSYTVVLTVAAHHVLRQWQVTRPIQVIPCCVDLTLFNPARFDAQKRHEIRRTLGINDTDFVIGYVGSLGTWYQYAEMVKFYKALKKARPNSRLMFITPDVERVERDDDLIVLSAIRQQVPEYLSIWQASICFISPTFSKLGSSATKVAEVMAMGIPLVVNSGWGDAEMIVEHYHAGVLVHAFSEVEFAGAAVSLTTGDFKSERIRQVAIDYFSLDKGIKKYREVYGALSVSSHE